MKVYCKDATIVIFFFFFNLGRASKKILSRPPPLSAPLAKKNKKSSILFDFFIHIPIETECSEMDNFDKTKNGLW